VNAVVADALQRVAAQQVAGIRMPADLDPAADFQHRVVEDGVRTERGASAGIA
jgi:hypothetical protein